MPTKNDVIAMALRRIGVLSADEAATADQYAYCGDVLDGVFAELPISDGLTFSWALDATPQAALVPLANLLATEVAPHYEIQSEGRFRALVRLRRYALTDDRADIRDADADGTVTTAEAEAGKRAEYY